MQKIRLNIFKAAMFVATNCSAGGISARCERVTLVGVIDKSDDPFNRDVTPLGGTTEPGPDAPAVVLVVRQGGVMHVQPLTQGFQHFMSGGAYVASCDSRWGEVLRHYGHPSGYCALDLHDRSE